jgi:hypothetical protein
MVRDLTAPQTVKADGKPAEVADVLAKVERQLQEGEVIRALEAIGRARISSPWLANAAGVCQLRLGNTQTAVDQFRALVLASGGLILREDVPTAFKTNYATALLASGNLSGGIRVLEEIRDEDNPLVERLRSAIHDWKKSLTMWQTVTWYLGGEPPRPLVLDFPLGDLE